MSLIRNALRYSGGAGPPAPTWQATVRPANPTIGKAVTTAGDSTAVGVGTTTSPTNYSWPSQMLGLATLTLSRKEVSGMAIQTGGQAGNTTPIATQITGQGAGLTNNHQLFSGGLNDYNSGVQTEPNLQNWDLNVYTTITGTIVPSFAGGSAQWWCYFLGLAEESSGPGMQQWANWRWLNKQLSATHGAHIFDIRRYAQFIGAQQLQNTLAVLNLNQFWGKPVEYWGNSTDLFASTAPTVWNWISTATNTAAGIEAAAPAAGYADGDIIHNVGIAFNAQGIWRKDTAGAWSTAAIDGKHFSRWGYAVWAQAAVDILAAFEGHAAPMPCPGELFCKQDDAAGTVLGTIYYVGASPTAMALFDANRSYVSALTLTDNGSVNGNGSITVTRAGTGALVEGEMPLDLQLTDGSGRVQHGPVDFRIGQPATQTVPRLWTLPYASEAPITSRTDFSGAVRQINGLVDGSKFFLVGWLKPSDLSTNPYIFAGTAAHGNSTDLNIQITSTGSLKVVAHNAAAAIVYNISVASVFTAGQATWFALELDCSPASPTYKLVYNKNGAGDTTASGTGTTGSTTLALSKMQVHLLALRDATFAQYAWQFNNATDAARGQYRGALGMLTWGSDSIGVSTTFDPRTVWNTNGTAVARAPMAAINGIVPANDNQGGIGDFLNGGFNASQPVHWTYRGIKGLT